MSSLRVSQHVLDRTLTFLGEAERCAVRRTSHRMRLACAERAMEDLLQCSVQEVSQGDIVVFLPPGPASRLLPLCEASFCEEVLERFPHAESFTATPPVAEMLLERAQPRNRPFNLFPTQWLMVGLDSKPVRLQWGVSLTRAADHLVDFGTEKVWKHLRVAPIPQVLTCAPLSTNIAERLISIDFACSNRFKSSIVEIGEGAFAAAPNLVSVDLSGMEKLQYIRKQCFRDCAKLTSVKLTGCVCLQEVGEAGFRSCPSLQYVDLQGCRTLRSLGEGVFECCNNLTNAADLSELKEIGPRCWRFCKKMPSIHFGKCPAEKIPYWLCMGCDSLQSVDLTSMPFLRTIEQGAFENCVNLTKADLSGLRSLTSLGNNCFHGCEQLTCLDLNGCVGLQNVGSDCCRHCSSLTAIDLTSCSPLKSVGGSAFTDCASLTAVNLRGLASPRRAWRSLF